MVKFFYFITFLLFFSTSTFAALSCNRLIKPLLKSSMNIIPAGTKVEITGLHPTEIWGNDIIGKVGIVETPLELDPLGVYSGAIRFKKSGRKYDFAGVKVKIIKLKKHDTSTIPGGTRVKITGLHPTEIWSDDVIGRIGVVETPLELDPLGIYSGTIKLEKSGEKYDFFGVKVEMIN